MRSNKGDEMIPPDKADKCFKFDVVSCEIWLRAFLWSLLCCWMWRSHCVSPPFEFHTNHAVTNGHEQPWRTAKARVFEICNVCLQREGRWSLQQLFIIQSAESGGCLQLSTSVYCWRHSQQEERHKAECVWTAGSHSELLFTLCALGTIRVWSGAVTQFPLINFWPFLISVVKCIMSENTEKCLL